MTDRGNTWVISRTSTTLAIYTYVDNLGALGTDPVAVNAGMNEATDIFNRLGLTLHEVEFARDGGTALGLVIDGRVLATYNTTERFHRLRKSIFSVLSRRRVAGWVLEVAVGHCTFFGLISLEMLSICRAVYGYINAEYHPPAVFWGSVREGLIAFVWGYAVSYCPLGLGLER